MFIKMKKYTLYKFKNKKYKLDLSYKNVLKAYSVLEDDILTDFEKSQVFVYIISKKAYRLSQNDLMLFLDKIIKKYINSNSKINSKNNAKYVDFKEDENYIKSAFKQSYNINLDTDFLSWSDFISYFQGLHDDTKIKEVMSIRARPLPKRTQYNADEISNLIELKEFYALKPNNKENNFNNEINNIFSILKNRAVN